MSRDEMLKEIDRLDKEIRFQNMAAKLLLENIELKETIQKISAAHAKQYEYIKQLEFQLREAINSK